MSYLKSAFSNLLTCKVSSKNKKALKLGPKFLFQHQTFNQHPRIFENIKFHPKRKKNNLGPKMLYFSLLGGMLKIYCHICNQHPSICLIWKFPPKTRILQLGTRNVTFGCFRQQLLYLQCWCWNVEVRCKKWYIFKFGTDNIAIFEINNLEFA